MTQLNDVLWTALRALEAMKAEFRMFNLPESKAYDDATSAAYQLRIFLVENKNKKDGLDNALAMLDAFCDREAKAAVHYADGSPTRWHAAFEWHSNRLGIANEIRDSLKELKKLST